MDNRNKSGHFALIVAAINVLLDRSSISRSPDDPASPAHGHIIVELAGHPTAIVWHDFGYGELSISVWWKFNIDAYLRRPPARMSPFATSVPTASRSRYPQFVGATVSVWLERRDGLFIQGHPPRIFDIYTRKGEVDDLRKIPWEEPRGFGLSGNYYL